MSLSNYDVIGLAIVPFQKYSPYQIHNSVSKLNQEITMRTFAVVNSSQASMIELNADFDLKMPINMIMFNNTNITMSTYSPKNMFYINSKLLLYSYNFYSKTSFCAEINNARNQIADALHRHLNTDVKILSLLAIHNWLIFFTEDETNVYVTRAQIKFVNNKCKINNFVTMNTFNKNYVKIVNNVELNIVNTVLCKNEICILSRTNNTGHLFKLRWFSHFNKTGSYLQKQNTIINGCPKCMLYTDKLSILYLLGGKYYKQIVNV